MEEKRDGQQEETVDTKRIEMDHKMTEETVVEDIELLEEKEEKKDETREWKTVVDEEMNRGKEDEKENETKKEDNAKKDLHVEGEGEEEEEGEEKVDCRLSHINLSQSLNDGNYDIPNSKVSIFMNQGFR